jgi:hypothetical protein
MLTVTRVFISFFVLVIGTLATAQTLDATPLIAATRLGADERLTIDGRLSEDAWRRAQPAGDFHQQDPRNGEPATERTDVWVLFDDHRLIVGVMCFDSQPERILGNQMPT